MKRKKHERVSVFVCGVQKGGTTSFAAYLSEHPQLSAPSRKETHFFDDETIDWSRPDYGSLHDYYAEGDVGKLRYDATPIYMYWENSLERLRDYNRQARLIFLFRDPFERAVSQWIMQRSRDLEDLDFGAALRAEQGRLRELEPAASERRFCSYVDRGLYGRQVRRALALFPREQMLFILSDDLRANPAAELQRAADFLGIAPFQVAAAKFEHSREIYSAKPSLTEADFELVAKGVQHDLNDFHQLTGLSIDRWPTWRFLRGEPVT